MVMRLTVNQEETGSIPVVPANNKILEVPMPCRACEERRKKIKAASQKLIKGVNDAKDKIRLTATKQEK